MLKNNTIKTILAKLRFTPTTEQHQLIDMLVDILLLNDNSDILIVNGYAGTGKTSIISAFVQYLADIKNPFKLLAPTGRAAKVLSNYSGHPAYTIHKEIYRQKSATDDFGSFDRNVNFTTQTVYVVDEASMIANDSYESSVFGTGHLLDDLIHYVFQNLKINSFSLAMTHSCHQLAKMKVRLW